jgi:hypothetical protein
VLLLLLLLLNYGLRLSVVAYRPRCPQRLGYRVACGLLLAISNPAYVMPHLSGSLLSALWDSGSLNSGTQASQASTSCIYVASASLLALQLLLQLQPPMPPSAPSPEPATTRGFRILGKTGPA